MIMVLPSMLGQNDLLLPLGFHAFPPRDFNKVLCESLLSAENDKFEFCICQAQFFFILNREL